MTLIRYLPLALLLPLLTACEPEVAPAKVETRHDASSAEMAQPTAATAPPLVTRPVTAPEPAATSEPAEVPEAARAQVVAPLAPAGATAEQPVRVEVEQTAPTARLDLSLPTELVEQLNAGAPATPATLAPLLPPLFEQKQQAPTPFQLSGRLLTNEGDEDYLESLEGAELQFEFKR